MTALHERHHFVRLILANDARLHNSSDRPRGSCVRNRHVFDGPRGHGNDDRVAEKGAIEQSRESKAHEPLGTNVVHVYTALQLLPHKLQKARVQLWRHGAVVVGEHDLDKLESKRHTGSLDSFGDFIRLLSLSVCDA